MWRITTINPTTHEVTITDQETGTKHSFIVPTEHLERHKKLAYIHHQIQNRPKVAVEAIPIKEVLPLPPNYMKYMEYLMILSFGIMIGWLCRYL